MTEKKQKISIPDIGLVLPSKNLSSVAQPGERISDIQKLVAEGTLYDDPKLYWAVYHHALLENENTSTHFMPQGETKYGLNDQVSFPNPFTLLSMLANMTEKNMLISTVIVSHYYKTANLARFVADIANQSKGRFILGVGTGRNPKETRALRMEGFYGRRGPYTSSQIPALEYLLTGQPVTLGIGRDEFGRSDEFIDNMGIAPGSHYPVPIGVGGLSGLIKEGKGRAIERAAKFGDGWFPMGDLGPFKKKLPVLLHYLEQNERSIEDFMLMGRVRLADLSTREAVNQYVEWMDAGATHVTTTTSINEAKEAEERGWSDWEKHRQLFLNFIYALSWLRHPGNTSLFYLFGKGWIGNRTYSQSNVSEHDFLFDENKDRKSFRLKNDQKHVLRYLFENKFKHTPQERMLQNDIRMPGFSDIPYLITDMLVSPNESDFIVFLQRKDQVELLREGQPLEDEEDVVVVYDSEIERNHFFKE